MTAWDPSHYEEFAEERLRPGLDLMARVELPAPGRIVDLGCGTGRLTAELATRWPAATVLGIDRSVEMMVNAPGQGVRYELGDIETWRSADPIDVLYANASLHWIPDQAALFPRLTTMLSPGGVLAVQMPLSWDQPSHRALREAGAGFGVEIASPPTLKPDAYFEILRDRAVEVEVWVTTYHHVLRGENPVYRWVSATGMKRFLDLIGPEDHPRYRQECARRIAAAYARNAGGETVFPFTRLFILARA